MAEYIELPNGKILVKFHQKPKRFKGTFKLNIGKKHFELRVDSNNQVYDILSCVVKSWKVIEKNKRKFTVPDVIIKHRVTNLFDRIKGRPLGLAVKEVKHCLESDASVESNL